MGALSAYVRAAAPGQKIYFDPHREICELEGSYTVAHGKQSTKVSTLVYNPRTKNAYAWTSAEVTTDILPIRGILAHVVKNACLQHVQEERQRKIENARIQLAHAEELRKLAISKQNHDIRAILANFSAKDTDTPLNFVTASGPSDIPSYARRETFVDKLHKALNTEQTPDTLKVAQQNTPQTIVPAFRVVVAPGGTQVAALNLPAPQAPKAIKASTSQAPAAQPSNVIPTAGIEHVFLLDQLKKGLNRALELSHDIQSAKYQLTAAQHALTATKNSKYNPEVSFQGFAGAGFGLKDDRSRKLDGISEKASTGLKVSMALMDGGKQEAEYNLATVGIRESYLSIKRRVRCGVFESAALAG